jgi:hypothetical protein
MGETEPVEVARAGEPVTRFASGLLLVPSGFNVLHAMAVFVAYRHETERLELQIWLLASGLTLLAQAAVSLHRARRRPQLPRPRDGAGADRARLSGRDFVVLLIALLVFVAQATFLGVALSSDAFGPSHPVGFWPTTGNWGRLLWAWYAFGATPLAYLQALVLTPYHGARLFERGSLRSEKARWLLSLSAGLSLATLACA